MAIIGALPVNIANGTAADASQVMSNFNWIFNQVNANAALLSLTPQLASSNVFTQPQTVASAVNGSQVPTASQVQNNLGYAADTGAVNAYVIAPAIPFTALTAGQKVSVLITNTNTGASTLKVNALTAKNIFINGSALIGGELSANLIYDFIYDGTQFQVSSLTNPFSDSSPLVKNSTDTTKKVTFSASSLTTATTRTLTVQDKNYTLAGLDDVSNVFPSGLLTGLTLSTAGSSATMSIASGKASDSTNAALMSLASSISKTTSSWAVGTGNGGLDTGAIANSTWYYWYLIRRPDTGVVDVIYSLSASAPTLPANYTQYRYIGAGLTNGSAQWVKFIQKGQEFYWDTPIQDFNGAGVLTASTLTCTLPRIVTKGFFSVYGSAGGGSYLSDLANSDLAPNFSASPGASVYNASGVQYAGLVSVWTNSSAQIRHREFATATLGISTLGWFDPNIRP